VIRWAAILLVVSAAVRLPRIDERPMHADEAILADKFGALLAGNHYEYDPREFHGPVLAYGTRISAFVAGQASYSQLTETTLRMVPAAAGILLALSPLLFAPAIGRGAAVAGAAILAVSPPMVYYSRFYIPETLLALGTAAMLAALWHCSRSSRPVHWAAAGAAAGFMLATKETAVLAMFAAAVGFLIAGREFARPSKWWPRALACMAGFLVVLTLFLAPPWKWAALAPAIPAYVGRGVSGGGHAHAWTYYFTLIWWVLPPAALGLVMALCSKRPFCRFLGGYSVMVALLYSAISYKTPWCVLTMLYGFALLAGIAIEVLARRWRAPVLVVTILGVASLGWLAWNRSTAMAADSGNPLAYAQTGKGVFTIRDRVRELVRSAPDGSRTAIAVYTQQNLWPLPWYFRDYPNVLWWRQVSIPGRAARIVILTPEMEAELARKIYEGPPPGESELYVNMFEQYVELRPGVEVRGYVAKSLWDRFR
jgi:uncharacterized protein (TIGR03663 family)